MNDPLARPNDEVLSHILEELHEYSFGESEVDDPFGEEAIQVENEAYEAEIKAQAEDDLFAWQLGYIYDRVFARAPSSARRELQRVLESKYLTYDEQMPALIRTMRHVLQKHSDKYLGSEQRVIRAYLSSLEVKFHIRRTQ